MGIPMGMEYIGALPFGLPDLAAAMPVPDKARSASDKNGSKLMPSYRAYPHAHSKFPHARKPGRAPLETHLRPLHGCMDRNRPWRTRTSAPTHEQASLRIAVSGLHRERGQLLCQRRSGALKKSRRSWVRRTQGSTGRATQCPHTAEEWLTAPCGPHPRRRH